MLEASICEERMVWCKAIGRMLVCELNVIEGCGLVNRECVRVRLNYYRLWASRVVCWPSSNKYGRSGGRVIGLGGNSHYNARQKEGCILQV